MGHLLPGADTSNQGSHRDQTDLHHNHKEDNIGALVGIARRFPRKQTRPPQTSNLDDAPFRDNRNAFLASRIGFIVRPQLAGVLDMPTVHRFSYVS